MSSIDFLMKRMMNNKLSEFGTGTTGEFRSIALAGDYLPYPSADLHIASGATTITLDPARVWVQGTLQKIPSERITRGSCGLVEKLGLYVVQIKTDKGLHEYTNEAISYELEEHFKLNTKIESEGKILTIKDSYQQPEIYIDSATGRYWNRVFVECVIYDKFN